MKRVPNRIPPLYRQILTSPLPFSLLSTFLIPPSSLYKDHPLFSPYLPSVLFPQSPHSSLYSSISFFTIKPLSPPLFSALSFPPLLFPLLPSIFLPFSLSRLLPLLPPLPPFLHSSLPFSSCVLPLFWHVPGLF